MTKRLCFIGNSHLIMVQEAWKARQSDAEATADFFACLIRYFDQLHVQDGKLVPQDGKLKESFLRSQGGDGIIDPDRYDGFVVAGMRLGIMEVYRLVRTYALTGSDLAQGKANFLMGEPLLRAWVRDKFEQGQGFGLVRMLRSVTDKPILLVPQPAPAEKILEIEAGDHLPGPEADFYRIARAAFDESLGALCDIYGLTLWKQPEDTMVGLGLTQSRFREGAQSFSGREFSDDDVGHMNPELGARVLDSVLGT